jgi:hypothetical protein
MPRTVTRSKRSLVVTHPSLAKEWHPTKNGGLRPQDFTHGSGKKVWWICAEEHAWKAIISNRIGARRNVVNFLWTIERLTMGGRQGCGSPEAEKGA